jgi:hypothetical protein
MELVVEEQRAADEQGRRRIGVHRGMIMVVGCNEQGRGRKKRDTSKTIFPVAGDKRRFKTTHK